MLKHASICRTNRAQQTLRAHWDEQLAGSAIGVGQEHSADDSHEDLNSKNNNNNNSSLIDSIWFAKVALSSDHVVGSSSCSSSPVPPSTPLARIPSLSSAPPSVFNSPSKSHSSPCGATTQLQLSSAINRTSTVSTIKIFAQTLSQEVEYVTLHVNAQTKSQQIIRSLLKKFRLKHRDPNLFYLTLERWIRKDGLKFKSVMLLGDDACPLQLQQCCSSPPHNDIKFALQVRTGALIKVFCSDVCQTTKYKCLSLSAQTTVDETIELMLHCLNLTHPSDRHATTTNEPFSRTLSTSTATTMTNHMRQASSPSSTSTSNSSASSTSSSSGIESDLTNQTTTCRTSSAAQLITNDHSSRMLDSNSRSSSVTSISSSSNTSHTSSSLSSSENFCLVIECENSNYKRILESNEHLVDVYQGLLDEAQERTDKVSTINTVNDASTKTTTTTTTTTTNRSTSSCSIETSSNKQPDQWFVIKLKRREDMSHPEIKFTNPRQNMPLPPIPLSLAQFNNVDNIQQIVSTTQIEVNNHHLQRRPSNCISSSNNSGRTANAATIARVNTIGGSSSISSSSSHCMSKSTVDEKMMMAFDTLDGHFPPQPIATASSRPINCHHQKQMSAIVSSNCNKMPPPPASLIWLPPIKPRRSRNLSNASSTFGRPLIGPSSSLSSCNRRRYDPAQLAEDLNRLDMNIGKGIDEAELNASKINESCSQGGLSTGHEQKQVIETAATATTATTSGTPVDDTIS